MNSVRFDDINNFKEIYLRMLWDEKDTCIDGHNKVNSAVNN